MPNRDYFQKIFKRKRKFQLCFSFCKIDAIIINQCGDMQEYRVPRPNDKIYEPILCPKLSQYYNKKFFCYPYLPNEEGEENDIPVFSKIKWFQQQFFNKLELNYVAQLLTENENLEPSSYILFAENFEYITFCDAIKVIFFFFKFAKLFCSCFLLREDFFCLLPPPPKKKRRRKICKQFKK